MASKNSHIEFPQCQIAKQQVWLNGELSFDYKEGTDFGAFAKAAYQQLGIKYPKFHKMDFLCKLGFLSFESLLTKIDSFEQFNPEKIGFFIANRYSSLETDDNYWATTQHEDGHPSPSLFVYTLPNIVIGEMCIRHKIKGEHSFFVFEEMDSEFICNYVMDLMQTNKLEAAVIGWLDSYHGEYRSNFVWVEADTLRLQSIPSIKQLF